MKRLVILAVLAAFAFGFASTASAVEMGVSGAWAIEASWMNNFDLDERTAEDNFNVFMRARQKFEFIANENLKAVLGTEFGTATWGQTPMAIGNAYSTANSRIGVREAYVDFNWPDTDVNIKAGMQSIYLPTAVGSGSMIMGEEVASVAISTPVTDYVSVLGGWARAAQNRTTFTGTQQGGNHYADAWFLAAPIALDGFNITPFFMYTDVGSGAVNTVPSAVNTLQQFPGLQATNSTTTNNGMNVWHGGIAFTMDYFDPFVVKADVEYGSLDGGTSQNDRSGWMGALAVEYTGWDIVTPELFFVYTSGEDGNSTHGDGGSERMPLIRSDWSVGSFWFGGDWGLNGGSLNGGNMVGTMGFWTAGLALKDFSFIEGMSHTVNVLYIQGTNDKDSIREASATISSGAAPPLMNQPNMVYGRYLTEDDSLWEFDLNTQYSIYDELTAYLELGYIVNDIDESRWRNAGVAYGNTNLDKSDAYKLSTGVAYVF